MNGKERQAGTNARPLDRKAVTVLHVLAPPDGKTRYVDHMLHPGPPELTAKPFSWHRALLTKYDVLHVHWPENLFRASNKVRSFAKAVLFMLLLAKLKLTSVAVVRTVHNLDPHEKGNWIEGRLVEALDRLVALYITLNSTTRIKTQKRVRIILHGHYRGRYQSQILRERKQNSILYFGLIRQYKGVPDLIRSFADLDHEDASLTIVGKPSGSELRNQITELCANDIRIRAILEFVPDDELAEEIRAAQLVVLPYKEMHNSGAMILALSLSRPVLVPKTEANMAIQAELGSEWVHTYESDELRSRTLKKALVDTSMLDDADEPNMDSRSWNNVKELHYRAYLDAIDATRQQS